MQRIVPPVPTRKASLWSISPWGVERIIIEDLIDELIVPNALSVVTCFLEGEDTSLNDLKNGVFLKKTRFMNM